MSTEAFTVVLLKPDYLCDDVPYGQSVHTVQVPVARCVNDAIEQAKAWALKHDDIEDPDDYAVLLVFPGLHYPCYVGGLE